MQDGKAGQMSAMIVNSAKMQSNKASVTLSQQFNTIAQEPRSLERRNQEQQHFRIRKFSRNGRLSQRSDSISQGEVEMDAEA